MREEEKDKRQTPKEEPAEKATSSPGSITPNPNPRANENIKNEETNSGGDAGSEITDGEAG